jgi:hypothetical protein
MRARARWPTKHFAGGGTHFVDLHEAQRALEVDQYDPDVLTPKNGGKVSSTSKLKATHAILLTGR